MKKLLVLASFGIMALFISSCGGDSSTAESTEEANMLYQATNSAMNAALGEALFVVTSIEVNESVDFGPYYGACTTSGGVTVSGSASATGTDYELTIAVTFVDADSVACAIPDPICDTDETITVGGDATIGVTGNETSMTITIDGTVTATSLPDDLINGTCVYDLTTLLDYSDIENVESYDELFTVSGTVCGYSVDSIEDLTAAEQAEFCTTLEAA